MIRRNTRSKNENNEILQVIQKGAAFVIYMFFYFFIFFLRVLGIFMGGYCVGILMCELFISLVTYYICHVNY